MSKAPAFQTYAADFYIDTNSWTIEEIGIYQRLLLTEWANGSVPNDEERLARIAGCKLKIFKKFWPIISQKFSQNGNGNLINKRMEQVRENQHKYIESQKQKAINRWKTKYAGADATAMPVHCSSSSSLSSSLNINSKEEADAPFKLPTKEEIEEGSDTLILSMVDQISSILYKEKIFPEVNAFKNKMLKNNMNPRSILHTLSRAYLKREFDDGPWAFCQKIITIEDKKYNARDYAKNL